MEVKNIFQDSVGFLFLLPWKGWIDKLGDNRDVKFEW